MGTEKCPPVPSKFGFTFAGTSPAAARSHPGEKLAPLPQATRTPVATESRTGAGVGTESSGDSKCSPFPPTRLKSPPPAPTQEPAFQRQASHNDKRVDLLDDGRSFVARPGTQGHANPTSRSTTAERGGVSTLPAASMQQRAAPQAQKQRAPVSKNDAPTETQDTDPMAMLMSQMQNLNRIQNRMQTNFA